jgi:hypothetical protein
MHKHFADWYSAVSLRLDAKTLESRWAAVEVLAGELKVPEVPSVVRVFFGLRGADPFLERIRTVVRDKDTTFVTEGDRNELTVLAGGVIAESVAHSSNEADAIALGVSCVGAQGLRQASRLQGVVDETLRYLADESVRTRAVSKNPVTDLNVASLTKLLSSRGGVAVSDVNSVWNGLDALLKEVLIEHTKHTESINTSLQKALNQQRERSDILWWLFSEHSLDGSKAFTDLTIPESCFWGARDLAALTQFLPGPFAAPAFLHKMLRLVKEKVPANVRLAESIDACDFEWKKKWVGELTVQELPDLCPMLFGIAKSVEVGGSTAWTAAFENATGLVVQGKLAPVHLALQIYSELLLLRALKAGA